MFPGFPDYWCAPGARPHLHVPGVTRGRGSMFKAYSADHPLKCGELKVLEGTHGTKPMGLRGGQVGLEKHTKPLKKKLVVFYF